MSATQALDFLARSGVLYRVHPYELTPTEATYGEAVAATLGVDPERVFKTLVAVVDGSATVAIVPVNALLSLKNLARATGGKKAVMASPTDAERWTGYVVGGISPFGQKRKLPTLIDMSAESLDTMYVSAGQRGLQVELSPSDVVKLTHAQLAPLV
ncbi:MAG TPA: Cys-tRNA(Pro) deacylase [Acidimicrobiia bacterium]|nr:Cys-tRNA(Pro) deacylase [Acidimicrobiia bacterium]